MSEPEDTRAVDGRVPLFEEAPTGMNGMILAAGFGTRVLPLTKALPKALLPVNGRSLLEWNLRYLHSQGISGVVVNAHHMSRQIEVVLRELQDAEGTPLPRVRLSTEEAILGTGGGLAGASHLLPGDPVVLLNVDMLFMPDLGPILEEHSRRSVLATIVCVRDPRHAKVQIEDHRVVRIHQHSQPSLQDLWSYTGLCILSRKAVEEVHSSFTHHGEAVFGDLRDLLLEWAEHGELGAWRETTARFLEAGSPEAYWELCREIHDQPGEYGYPPVDGPGSRPKCWSDANESVVMPGAFIEPGVRATRCVLGPGTRFVRDLDRIAAAAGEMRPMAIPAPRDEEMIMSAMQGVPDCRLLENTGRTPRPSIRRLKGDGSGRTLFRVVHSGQSWIVVREPDPSLVPPDVYPSRQSPESPGMIESYLYIHDSLRERGVRVPAVLHANSSNRTLILEDLGDRHLSDLVTELTYRPAEIRRRTLTDWYEKALDQLAAIQGPLGRRFELERTDNVPYDPGFVRQYEIGYFLREMVYGYLGLQQSDDHKTWSEEIGRLEDEAFNDAPDVLMHRDFQSRNLMIAGNDLTVIDFQGARCGPPEYDLASLIYDPYACLTDDLRADLTAAYLRRISSQGLALAEDACGVRTRLRACGICRLMQALGAFAYLGGRLGKPGFLEHAPAAAKTLAALASDHFPAVASLADRVYSTLVTLQSNRAGVDLRESPSHPATPDFPADGGSL